MEYFGSKITREIWSNDENIVLVYVGSAADFALNPENHWLFYTGRLPADPQKRFIQTFKYNRMIFFTPTDKIPELMSRIRAIHSHIENSRTKEEGTERKMSNLAFREVADMLIDYGIKGWEYLHRKNMEETDKENYYNDMKKMQELMGVNDLPQNYAQWQEHRQKDIQERLQINEYTWKLYEAYKRDLGNFRFWLLRQFQAHFIDKKIADKLKLHKNPLVTLLYNIYPLPGNWDWMLVKRLIIKSEMRNALNEFGSSHE